jgi:uncharacterized protein DUF6777
MSGSRRPIWLIALAVVLLFAIAGGALLVLGGDEAKGQTVQFQKPTESGPDPFTPASDVTSRERVQVGSGPFGGTGSDLVCDRELLIRSLHARPDRLREWARVLKVNPTPEAVAAYIRKLRPVTLTRDTRVTNHNFVGGRAEPYQAILQAGTAVLVDEFGKPVARCRCGNPLLEPIYIKEAECIHCPPNYRPPPPCKWYDFHGDRGRRYRPSDFEDYCYFPHPNPPKVSGGTEGVSRTPAATPATNPTASFSPSSGSPTDTYTLSVSGFSPNSTLSIRLRRPDGVEEPYSLRTGADGSGSYTFPPAGNPPLGTYTATVTDPATGRTATATTTVSASEGQQEPRDQTTPEATPPSQEPQQQPGGQRYRCEEADAPDRFEHGCQGRLVPVP